MSAPPARGRRGSTVPRGRGATFSTSRGRGSSNLNTTSRGKGRGRGGGVNTTSNQGEGLLQKLRSGALQRTPDSNRNTQTRGRGSSRGTPSTGGRVRQNQSQSDGAFATSTTTTPSTLSGVPTSHRDFMNDMTARFQKLKQMREVERTNAIRDGFLADPEKKTSLDKAITPVGTCTEMCPEFERVERIVQNMVDKSEKVSNDATGRDMPSQERMVKRFRRSAAGYDEQLPSDIRTPQTLRKTLDYLLDQVIGGPERLASVHKFVWDRTRGIRNDFSIQQVTKQEDVKIAVECYERIARFHILSLHQLSNPDHLLEGENFDSHQEREQLNNTLLSLMYYYDDHRHSIPLPNEAEFRAYCILFEFQSQHPDLEDRMQSWPMEILDDKRVQTAFSLFCAAGNTLTDQGPLRPMIPYSIARADMGIFWSILASKSVPYIMACVAEIYFSQVRFTALDAIWRSAKNAPAAQQARSRDWTLIELTNFLGFDTDEQTTTFCAIFGLSFATDENGEQYLDLSALSTPYLDKLSIPSQQVFSHSYVEEKRFRRTLVAVINGVGVSDAIREGLVHTDDAQDSRREYEDDDQSMFIPEKVESSPPPSIFSSPSNPGFSFNPQASSFTSRFGETIEQKPQTNTALSTSAPTTQLPQPTTHDQPSGLQAQQPKATNPLNNNLSKGFNFSAPTSSPAPIPAPSPFQGFNFKQPSQPDKPSPESTQTSNLSSLSSPSSFFKPTVTFPSTTQGTINVPTEASTTVTNPASFTFTPFPTTTTAPTQTQKSSIFKPDITSPPPSLFPPINSKLTAPADLSVSEAVSTSPSSLPPQTTVFPFANSNEPKPQSAHLSSAEPITKSSTSNSTAHVRPPLQSFDFSLHKQATKSPLKEVESVAPEESINTSLTKVSTTPPTSPPLPEPPVVKIDRSQIVDSLARLSLVQQNGLMQEYIEFILPNMLRNVIRQHQKETHDSAIASIRNKILVRKFGSIWRDITWKSSLNRRAKNRRRLFAETIRAEQDKKKRNEDELQAILDAAKETRRLQEEVKVATEMKKDSEKNGDYGSSQSTGRKRKSFSDRSPPTSNTKVVQHHKRSRTLTTSSEGSSKDVPIRTASSKIHENLRLSVLSGKSVFGRSNGPQDLNRQRLDTTKTDYFKLKALGIDPETPIIPYTKESLALKRQREENERQAFINQTKRRPSSKLTPTPMEKSEPTTRASSFSSPAAKEPRIVEDDFLKQLREAREAMAGQEQWFKDQAIVLKQQEEEEKKSPAFEDHNMSVNGLRKINGYEYMPLNNQQGRTLSATERRIRSTGAHGLATKPVRKTSDYYPVAMSKTSALRYTMGETETISEVNGLVRESVEEKVHPTKRHSKPIDNRFDLLQDVQGESEEDEQDENTEELVEDEEYEEDEQHNGDTEDYDEEEMFDEEEEQEDEIEEQDEDEEEEEEDQGQYYYGNPSTQMSRASTNGPGASADDALVLSD